MPETVEWLHFQLLTTLAQQGERCAGYALEIAPGSFEAAGLSSFVSSRHLLSPLGRPEGVDRLEIRDGRLWLITQGYFKLALTLRPTPHAETCWRLLCVDILVEDLSGLNAAEARES